MREAGDWHRKMSVYSMETHPVDSILVSNASQHVHVSDQMAFHHRALSEPSTTSERAKG